MRILRKDMDGSGGGMVRVVADTGDDLWLLYNLISPSDLLASSTVRKVAAPGAGATGGDTSRIRTKLTISVESASFDGDGGEESVVRVSGKNVEENEYVRLGAYHTLALACHHPVDITKANWDTTSMKSIQDACDIGKSADVVAVLMEAGHASIVSVTPSLSIQKAKIEMSVPKKHSGSEGHDKGMYKFFEAVLQSIIRLVNFATVKAVIIASPGFVKDDFYAYMQEQAGRVDTIKFAASRDLKVINENKDRFILAHASSGHKQALQSVFMDSTVMARLSDTRAASEVTALQNFYKALNTNSTKAYYGYQHVRLAADRGAIETLLLSDALLRSRHAETRTAYSKLQEDVHAAGGSTYVFSSMHVSGEQLSQMSGVAAMLRFPIPDMDEASAMYAKAVMRHRHSAKELGSVTKGSAPEDSGGEVEAEKDPDHAYDSDASSDSDASYKQGTAAGTGAR